MSKRMHVHHVHPPQPSTWHPTSGFYHGSTIWLPAVPRAIALTRSAKLICHPERVHRSTSLTDNASEGSCRPNTAPRAVTRSLAVSDRRLAYLLNLLLMTRWQKRVCASQDKILRSLAEGLRELPQAAQDDYTCGSLQPEPRGSRAVAVIEMTDTMQSSLKCENPDWAHTTFSHRNSYRDKGTVHRPDASTITTSPVNRFTRPRPA